MRFWAINENAIQNGKIQLKSRRQISIAERDKIIAFVHFGKDIKFVWQALISEKKQEEAEEINFFEFHLVEISNLTNPCFISDYAYSLQKIYRYDSPEKHFRRKYISLSESDFITLVKSKIFWARTAFGLFINQLPQSQLIQFIQEIAEINPNLLLRKANFSELWRELRRFIEEEYISTGVIFEHIRGQLERLEDSEVGIQYELLRLSSENFEQNDSIKDQEKLFSDFLQSISFQEKNKYLLYELDSKIQEDEDVESFERLFEGTLWPLQRIEI